MILVITQFVLISIGGYFIYGNYEKNISQSKNIQQLSSNAQVIKENTNNRIENVESNKQTIGKNIKYKYKLIYFQTSNLFSLIRKLIIYG